MGLSNSWGDDVDDELKKREKLKVGFMWNFISTNNMITRMDQEVGEVDKDYPRTEIEKMWYSTLVIMVIFELLFYNALCIIAIPFFFLYGMLLFKMAKLFKRFNYSVTKYWMIAIISLIIGGGLYYLIWFLLPNM